MKLVPDPSQRAAEKEILKGLGFTVIGRLTATPKGLKARSRTLSVTSRTR
jgi:hypothetical protein